MNSERWSGNWSRQSHQPHTRNKMRAAMPWAQGGCYPMNHKREILDKAKDFSTLEKSGKMSNQVQSKRKQNLEKFWSRRQYFQIFFRGLRVLGMDGEEAGKGMGQIRYWWQSDCERQPHIFLREGQQTVPGCRDQDTDPWWPRGLHLFSLTIVTAMSGPLFRCFGKFLSHCWWSLNCQEDCQFS